MILQVALTGDGLENPSYIALGCSVRDIKPEV